MPATVTGADEVRLDQGPTVRAPSDGLDAGRALPRRGPAREASDRGARRRRRRLDGPPRVEGIVESSLYLGTATQIAVDLGEDVRMTVLVPNATRPSGSGFPAAGPGCALSWEPEHMHLVRESPRSGRGGGRATRRR